jgi:alpha-mannosidase
MVIMEDHPNYWEYVLQLFLPHCQLMYSAWDVDQFHLEKQTHLKFGQVRIVQEGPLRATLGTTVQLGQSKMDIEISLDAIPASLKVDARSLIRFHAVM